MTTTMNKYKVTLNFTFEQCYWDDNDYDVKNMKAKKSAFDRTDAYYEKHSLTDHIKSNSAVDFVESTLCDGELLSAEWDDTRFAIHMVVETDESADELRKDLESNSLEDGEYEACGDTGWIVMTRGPNGERFGPPWDTEDTWVYGFTDYRNNPILVTKLEDTPSN